MDFIESLIKLIIRLAMYAFAFVVLVWFFLGIGPWETWTRTKQHLRHMIYSASSSVSDIAQTAGDMKNVANYHLKQASDRIDGKDPYEDFNKQLDQQVQRDLGRN